MGQRYLGIVGLLVVSAFSQSACRGPTWQVGSSLLVTNRQVREALHDPVLATPDPPRFDPTSVPLFDAPGKVRPCCPFGMDLKVKVGAVTVPGYQKGNIIAVDDIGKHEYDNGVLTIQAQPGRSMILENNGLVYTCRGGFIDLAHIRDNADLTLFLAMRIARELPGEMTIELPDQGTKRRVIIKKIPAEVLTYYGRMYTATAMAQYIAYHMSIWHEVVTWYDWQSVKGFSERLSAFSPEDAYSNILGILISTGIIRNQGAQTRDDYDHSMDAWIPVALRRLGAVTETESRAAMKAVDGVWWTSKREIPDAHLVLRRKLDVSKMPALAWNVAESIPASTPGIDPSVHTMCNKQPEPLELSITEHLGRIDFAEYLRIEFEFTDGWKPDSFPYPKGQKLVTQADLPAIMDEIRKDLHREFGPGSDTPKPISGAPVALNDAVRLRR